MPFGAVDASDRASRIIAHSEWRREQSDPVARVTIMA